MSWTDLIKEYKPYNEQEEKDKEVILRYSGIFDDMLTRDNELIHVTSSAFVVNKSKDKVLMVHHNIYNSWSWVGGHADGEGDLLKVALKETSEETGVKNIQAIPSKIFALDILPVIAHVKKGRNVAAHLHITATYLIEADENESLIVKKDENSGVKWIPIEKVNEFSNEPHMQRIYNKLILKIKESNI